MIKLFFAVIAFVLAIISIKTLNKKAKERGYVCSDLDFLYGDRFRIYSEGENFFVYDREFRQDISINNVCLSFESHQEAEEFLLEYGDLFTMFEDDDN